MTLITWHRRSEIFFRTWSGGNFDDPEATRDDLEATLMVRMQQISNTREIDGPEATRDGLEATLMVWMQQYSSSVKSMVQ